MKAGDIKTGESYLLIGTGYSSRFRIGLRGRGRFVPIEAPANGMVKGRVYDWEASSTFADAVKDGTVVVAPTRLLEGPYEEAMKLVRQEEEDAAAAQRRLQRQNANVNAIRAALRASGLVGEDVKHVKRDWLFGSYPELTIGLHNIDALARRLDVKLPHPEIAAEDRRKGEDAF
jgi:hypothetical protein